MSRLLNDLAPIFQPLAFELLARATEADVSVVIVETRRTMEKHLEDLASGHSWIQHSKHLDGLAIDICPYDTYSLHGPDKLEWEANDPAWQTLGTIGEQLGLRWGGRWQQRDMGHFEYVDHPTIGKVA